MRQVDVILLTKIPHTQSQILSYFSGADLPSGALVQVPLGKRLENGIVLKCSKIDKMQIKKADFGLKNVTKILSEKPILTPQQITLALFLGNYYFASPGLFLKMSLPKKINAKSSCGPSKKSSASGGQKLILAPTIASAKKISASHKNVLLWHGELTAKQKNDVWYKIKNGQAQTIIGTRSAAFLPFYGLKEIIIEDAKNSGHRSWDMWPHYESFTVAKKLAEIFKANLKPCEVGLRKVSEVVDMREELKAKNFSVFSYALENAVKEALTQKKQIILFANRRGAANFILCRDCGAAINCPNCDAPLAFHLISGQAKLLCHRCGHKDVPPGRCPACRSLRIKTVGSGTQKIESETQKFFPEAKIARLDSDLAPEPKDQQKIIDKFKAKEIDILITTQIAFSWLAELAAAKPSVVAILSADTLLHLPDFRSGERTWQTIATLQAATRPRNDTSFIIQTYNPANSAIRYAAENNWESFWQEELETRQALDYPPYSQIVKLTFRHRDGKKAGQEAKILAAKLQQANKDEKIDISSALPAFVPREKGKFIWNIILKFIINNPQLIITNEFLHRRNLLLRYIPQNWEIDVDPENLL